MLLAWFSEERNQRLGGVGGHPVYECQAQGSALGHPTTGLE